MGGSTTPTHTQTNVFEIFEIVVEAQKSIWRIACAFLSSSPSSATQSAYNHVQDTNFAFHISHLISRIANDVRRLILIRRQRAATRGEKRTTFVKRISKPSTCFHSLISNAGRGGNRETRRDRYEISAEARTCTSRYWICFPYSTHGTKKKSKKTFYVRLGCNIYEANPQTKEHR